MLPLNEGGWLYEEALDWARQQVFVLMRLIHGFTDPPARLAGWRRLCLVSA